MKKSLLVCMLILISILGFAQKPSKTNSKLHPDLQGISNGSISIAQLNTNALSVSSPEVIYSKDGSQLLVSLIAKNNTQQLRDELKANGINVVSSFGGLVSAYIAPENLSKLETIGSLQFARPSYKPDHDATVIGQGDAALKADIARSARNVNGAGVKIGVLSDSYNYLGGAATGVTNDELPGVGNPNGFTTPVQVLLDNGNSDEGRGMMEIIHDIAPAATLAFHTANGGMTTFANGILALANNGCKVIVDDVRYFEEPMFQDGVIAQAVNQVKSQGIPYFASQGNYASRSFEATYRAGSVAVPAWGGTTINAHNFAAPGNPDRYFLPISVVSGSAFILQWDNPFKSANPLSAGATTDIDLHFFSGSNGTGYIGSAAVNNLGNDAVEITSLSGTGTLYIAIEKYAGPDPGYLKLVMRGGNSSFPNTTGLAGNFLAGTGYGHSNATGAIAVGAVEFTKTPVFGTNPPTIESFSSRGAVPILFDAMGNRLGSPEIRNKPNISAPDGANTSFFGFDSSNDPDALPNFFGTSAAAPHAAAVAALMIQSRRGQPISPDQIKTFMQNSCIDMDDPDLGGFQTGFDFRTGYGLLQADVVVAATDCNFSPNPTSSSQCLIPTSITLKLSASGGGSYSWRGPNNFSSTSAAPTKSNANILDNGTYSVTVTATNGCTASATVKTLVGANLVAGSNSPVLVGQTLQLTANAQVSYKWAKNSFSSTIQNPMISPMKISDAGLYLLTATATNGCVGSAIVPVYAISSGARLVLDPEALNDTENLSMKVSENPTNGRLSVMITTPNNEPVQLNLFSLIGTSLYAQESSESQTLHVFDIDISTAHDGIYILKASTSSEQKSIRIFKVSGN